MSAIVVTCGKNMIVSKTIKDVFIFLDLNFLRSKIFPTWFHFLTLL